jgi:hypothetical protein
MEIAKIKGGNDEKEEVLVSVLYSMDSTLASTGEMFRQGGKRKWLQLMAYL